MNSARLPVVTRHTPHQDATVREQSPCCSAKAAVQTTAAVQSARQVTFNLALREAAHWALFEGSCADGTGVFDPDLGPMFGEYMSSSETT